MTSTAQLEDYQWLTSDDAEPWLSRAAESSSELVALTSHLRDHLSATRTHLVLEQVDLRRRGIAKFPQSSSLFFLRQLLQQATDQRIADYKAKSFPDGAPAADLCCGIGGDSMSLGRRGPIASIDRDPVATCLAEANLTSCRIGQFQVLCQPVDQVPLESYSAWHIDPDRRPAGRRTTQVDAHEPATAELNELLRRNANAAIKLAPAAVLPANWLPQAELEWIGHNRQCQQLVARFGLLASTPGLRRATVLDDSGSVATQIVGRGDEEVELKKRVGRFVLEPHPAVLAAKLDGRLAAEHGAWQLSPLAAYYSADSCPTDLAFSAFELLETLPFDIKRIKRVVRHRDWKVTEVKKRGIDKEPASVLKKLRGHGSQEVTLIILGQPAGATAILSRRIGSR